MMSAELIDVWEAIADNDPAELKKYLEEPPADVGVCFRNFQGGWVLGIRGPEDDIILIDLFEWDARWLYYSTPLEEDGEDREACWCEVDVECRKVINDYRKEHGDEPEPVEEKSEDDLDALIMLLLLQMLSDALTDEGERGDAARKCIEHMAQMRARQTGKDVTDADFEVRDRLADIHTEMEKKVGEPAPGSEPQPEKEEEPDGGRQEGSGDDPEPEPEKKSVMIGDIPLNRERLREIAKMEKATDRWEAIVDMLMSLNVDFSTELVDTIYTRLGSF